MSDHDPMTRWMRHLATLDQARAGLPDRAHLVAVATELGLDAAVLGEAEAEAQRARRRGQGFARHGRLDDAVTELTRAQELAPWCFEVVDALAHVLADRFARAGQADDKAHAERLARQLLASEPDHQPAYALLNRLEQPPAQAPRRGRLGVSVAVAAGLAVVAGLVALVTLGGSDPAPVEAASSPALVPPPAPVATAAPGSAAASRPLEATGLPAPPEVKPPDAAPPPVLPDAAPPPVPDAAVEAALPDAAVEVAPPATAPSVAYAAFPLPVEVVHGPGTEGTEVEVSHSEHSRGGYPQVRFSLRITNRSADEITRWQAWMVLLDGDDAEERRHPVPLVNPALAALRPGDRTVRVAMQPATNATRKVRVLLDAPERAASAGDAPATAPACLRSRLPKVAERVALHVRNQGSTPLTTWLDLEVENLSGQPIRTLMAQALYLDGEGAPVVAANIADNTALVSSLGPALGAGERHVMRVGRFLDAPGRQQLKQVCFDVTELD